MKNIKGVWIFLLVVFIIVSVALALFFTYQRPDSSDEVHSEDLDISVCGLSEMATFELVFSRFIIEYWMKISSFPTANETCNYIESLKFKTSKESFGGMMTPQENLFDAKDYEIFNYRNEILIVRYKIVNSKLLFNILQDQIGVVLYFSLDDLLKIAKIFNKSEYPGLPDYAPVKTLQQLGLLKNHLKWLPVDNAKELVSLFNNNHSNFKKSWAKNTSLLNFDRLQDNLKKYFFPKELDRTIYMRKSSILRAFDFLIEYVLTNQEKLLVFSRRLESETTKSETFYGKAERAVEQIRIPSEKKN